MYKAKVNWYNDYEDKDEVSFIRSFSMKQTDMAVVIERISYAASLEDSRKVLQGILFSVRDGKFTAVATDGKRLALCEKVFEELPEGSEGEIIITQKAATELKRLLEKEGDVVINIAENQVVFVVGVGLFHAGHQVVEKGESTYLFKKLLDRRMLFLYFVIQ